MMLKPDLYFDKFDQYFDINKRISARKLFRRAVRDYYVMQRRFVFEPKTGKRVESIFYGEYIQQQKKQRRKVKQFFNGRTSAGRPKRPEVILLISRLFILWRKYSIHPATVSWKIAQAVPTIFEEFLLDLLPRLGASDVRRYIEKYLRERK